MKKTLLLICLLTLSLSVFAQHSKDQVDNDGIDYLIIEMKLGAVLGGYKNGKFVNAQAAAKGLKINEDYTLFGMNVGKNEGILKVTKRYETMDDICPEYVGVETDSKAKSGVALSSNARWNATPRIPKVVSSNSRVYRGVVRKFLQSEGIRRPNVKIQKILRVDLEGDGTDEVLIQATNRPNNRFPSVKRGDYSFVLLRKIVGGKVKNILLTGEIHKKSTDMSVFSIFEISTVLDLDADGKMEVVTYGSYHEGAWSVAHRIDKNGKSKNLLETGCGV